MIQKTVTFLAVTALVLFSVFYLTIAWHNRLSNGDDMFLLLQLKKSGILHSIMEFSYNKRYSSFFFFNLVFYGWNELTEANSRLFLYHFFFLAVNLIAMYSFSKNMLHIIGINDFSKAIQLAASLTIGLFFIVPQLIEVWVWPTGSFVYGIPIPFIFWGTALILNNSSKWYYHISIAFCFFIVGGTMETLAILASTILLIFFFLVNKFNWASFLRVKLLIAILATCVLLLLNLSNGWVSNRLELESIENVIPGTTFLSILSEIFDKNNLVLLPLLVILFFLGASMRERSDLQSWIDPKKLIRYNLIIIIAAAVITFYPLTVVFQGFGPQRAWLPFFLILFLSLCMWTFVIALRTKMNFSLRIVPLAWSLVILFFIFTLLTKIEPLRNYSRKYDECLSQISRERDYGRRDLYFIDPLPEPEYLVRFRLTNDPSHWYNQLFQQCMKCDFEIAEFQETVNTKKELGSPAH